MRTSLALVVLLCAACASSSKTDAAPAASVKADSAPALNVSKYGKVFRDRDGDITVEMVVIEPKNGYDLNNVLLRFNGQAAEVEKIDGKVLQYDASHGGRGVDYTGSKADGTSTIRMISRESGYGSGGSSYECYLDHKTFKIFVDDVASKALDTSKLLADYDPSWKPYN